MYQPAHQPGMGGKERLWSVKFKTTLTISSYKGVILFLYSDLLIYFRPFSNVGRTDVYELIQDIGESTSYVAEMVVGETTGSERKCTK